MWPLKLLIVVIYPQFTQCRPQQSLVATTTTEGSSIPDNDIEDEANNAAIISEFDIRSDIQFRYAHTVVTSYVKNPSAIAKEVTFTMVIPNTAFVSNFSMVLKDKEYVATVREKEAAQNEYHRAVAGGQSAGIVNQDTRDANKISVSANVGPLSKIRFRLTYEELLQRRLERYEHVIHVNPGQVVDVFKVEVFINESLPLSRVRVPQFKTDPNSISVDAEEPNLSADVVMDPVDNTKARVSFKPTVQYQKEKGSSGLAGQFVVQYDVDRKEEGSDVQTIDGYFVHFFSPDHLQVLPKHVIFVIDVSGSMSGEKLQQTKDAMVTIIDDMTDQDYFNIITFSDAVTHWIPEDKKSSVSGKLQLGFQGTQSTRSEALKYVLQLNTLGGTNINDGLLEAVDLLKRVRQSETAKAKPIIIFMTDGQATTGITGGDDILANVRAAEEGLNAPIYGLAFGESADFDLMKRLSVENKAFARRIYEKADAALQLETFYAEIASPLLSNVTFDYVGINATAVTKSTFGSYNRGNELIIAGKIDQNSTDFNKLEIGISGEGSEGRYNKEILLCIPPYWPRPIPLHGEGEVGKETSIIAPFPTGCHIPPTQPNREPRSDAQNFVERLWAFLTIRELLDEKESTKSRDGENGTIISNNSDHTVPPRQSPREKALEIALKYNFVTPVTSLVVVKPSEDSVKNSSSSNEELTATRVDLTPVDSHDEKAVPFVRYSSYGGGHIMNQQLFLTRKAVPAPQQPFPLEDENVYATTPIQYTTTFSATSTTVSSTSTPRTSTTNLPPAASETTSCSGSISLFGKTYLRGANLTLTEQESDLSKQGFVNMLTSLKVDGECCWQIYSEANFQGSDLTFRVGQYNSASEMQFLFRNAGSVKKVSC